MGVYNIPIPTYWVLIPWLYRCKRNPTALPSRVDSSTSPVLYPVYSFYIPMISIFDPNYTPCPYPLCWVKGFWFLARSRSALPRRAEFSQGSCGFDHPLFNVGCVCCVYLLYILFTHIYIYTYTHIYMCVYIYICAYVYTYYMYICLWMASSSYDSWNANQSRTADLYYFAGGMVGCASHPPNHNVYRWYGYHSQIN